MLPADRTGPGEIDAKSLRIWTKFPRSPVQFVVSSARRACGRLQSSRRESRTVRAYQPQLSVIVGLRNVSRADRPSDRKADHPRADGRRVGSAVSIDGVEVWRGARADGLVSARARVRERATQGYLKHDPKEPLLSVQIFGGEPESMARAAEISVAGAKIIDINMGCPVKKVTRTGAGSSLLRSVSRRDDRQDDPRARRRSRAGDGEDPRGWDDR
jgi:hypothetical protein